METTDLLAKKAFRLRPAERARVVEAITHSLDKQNSNLGHLRKSVSQQKGKRREYESIGTRKRGGLMLEINVEETRDNLITLLEKVAQDKEIIIRRHGKRIARLISEEREGDLSLPSLASFRASVHVKGKPLSQTLIELRDEERY